MGGTAGRAAGFGFDQGIAKIVLGLFDDFPALAVGHLHFLTGGLHRITLVYQDKKFCNTGTEKGVVLGQAETYRRAERKVCRVDRGINGWFLSAAHEMFPFSAENAKQLSPF